MRRFLSGILAASALGLGLLAAVEPAEAARNNSCLATYRACEQRCAGRAGNGDWLPCINRTCNRQYDNCQGAGRGFAAPTRADRAPTRPGPIVGGPHSPRGPVNTGPFPSDYKPRNGGIVPGGGAFKFGRRD